MAFVESFTKARWLTLKALRRQDDFRSKPCESLSKRWQKYQYETFKNEKDVNDNVNDDNATQARGEVVELGGLPDGEPALKVNSIVFIFTTNINLFHQHHLEMDKKRLHHLFSSHWQFIGFFSLLSSEGDHCFFKQSKLSLVECKACQVLCMHYVMYSMQCIPVL